MGLFVFVIYVLSQLFAPNMRAREHTARIQGSNRGIRVVIDCISISTGNTDVYVRSEKRKEEEDLCRMHRYIHSQKIHRITDDRDFANGDSTSEARTSGSSFLRLPRKVDDSS